MSLIVRGLGDAARKLEGAGKLRVRREALRVPLAQQRLGGEPWVGAAGWMGRR